jgi:MTH538 TIR-like domain (DUF1863)
MIAASDAASDFGPMPATDRVDAPVYDAFISYSHARDKPIATTLQSVVQKLGKPWYRRRVLRVFRDDTGLTATPHLWPSIERALERSRFLILLASTGAANSPWVDKEVAWWIDHKGADTVLIALTDGELSWDGATGDFCASPATPLPPALKGHFAHEPRWIDLRPYRNGSSARDTKFADLAADFAAAIREVPKEDLLSQEVREQRRALRLAWSGVGTLILFLALAGWQWRTAEVQRQRAERTLALATETANDLVFDLAQKFRDKGLPAAVGADILDRARRLETQLRESGEASNSLSRTQAAALDESAKTLLLLGKTEDALAAAKQANAIDQALAAANPGVAVYQEDLSATDNELGDVKRAQGDLAGAWNPIATVSRSPTGWQNPTAATVAGGTM